MPVVRESKTAQGTAARRHSVNELACSSGGALNTVPVVREFLRAQWESESTGERSFPSAIVFGGAVTEGSGV